jgi:hypothetical protein
MLSRSLLAIAVGLALLGAPREVLAAPITFTFTGTVTSIQSARQGIFDLTQTLSGSYTFDSLSPDLFPADPALGRYSPLVLNSLTFTIGSFTGGRVGPNLVADRIEVLNSQFDAYSARWVQVLTGPDGETLLPGFFAILLLADAGPALVSDTLPLTPPTLAEFRVATWNLILSPDATDFASLAGHLTSLDLAPVPEPATLLLFGTTATGLGLAHWRQQRRRQQT